MRRTFLIGVLAALALTACGGGGGGSSGGATCSPSGATLTVTTQNFAFDKSCYAAPADQPFTINFDNKDSAPHNIAIYIDSTASKPLFQPPTITSSTTVYHAKPLGPGTYYFQCDVHTSMNGTFIVE